MKKKIQKKDKNLKKIEEKDMISSTYNAPLGAKIKHRLMDKFKGDRIIVINMELANGMHIHFPVSMSFEGFSYKGGDYLFDDEFKYYDLGFKSYCLDYHENFNLPIRRRIPLTSVQKVLEASGLSEVEYATNPATLKRFKIAKIGEGVMKAQQFVEELKAMRLAIYIGTGGVIIHLILFIFKTGMLNSIKIPGFG